MSIVDVVIIGNPASGRGSMEILKRCAETLGEKGAKVEIWPTERPEHATELATLAGACLVVAAGGDGTVNEVINGLEKDATLGILPLGTANVLARELGLPLDADGACRRILEGRTARIDLGTARDSSGFERKFACMAGIGFDASVVQAVKPRLKRYLGVLAFALTAFQVLFMEDLPPFEVVHDGKSRKARFVIIANGHYYGGSFQAAELASLTNGQFEVVLVERVRRILRPDILGSILAKKPLSRSAISFPCEDVHARAAGAKVPVQLDGEVWGYLPMSFRIEPRALQVIR